MYSNHAAPWTHHYDERDRITHNNRTKQCEKEEQTLWTWEEILDGKRSWTMEEILAGAGPWTQPGEYRRSKMGKYRRIEERRQYEGTRLARKPERLWGDTRGDWLSQVGYLSQLLMLTLGSV